MFEFFKDEILSANNCLFYLTNNVNYSFLGLNISHDTIFTVVTTIGIFVAGILIERYLSLLKKYQEKKEIVEIVYENLKKTINHTLPQAKDIYRKSIDSISLKNSISSSSDKLIAEEIFVPLSINYQFLFNAFTDKNTVISIVNCTKFIKEAFSGIDAEHRDVYRESNVIEQQISDELGKLFSLIDEYIYLGQDRGEHMTDERYQRIHEITYSLDRSIAKYGNLEYLKNNFLLSLYKEFKTDNYFNKDRNVFRIFTLVKEILVLIIRIENNQKSLKEAYYKCIGNISKAEGLLAKYLKSIEENEPKSFCKYFLTQIKRLSPKL